MLLLEHSHNHPALRTFCQVMFDTLSTKSKHQPDHTVVNLNTPGQANQAYSKEKLEDISFGNLDEMNGMTERSAMETKLGM